MRDALITVVIPTFNRSGLLREALASVLEQDVEGMEVIVADNASADDTPEIVAAVGDRRVRLDRLGHNIGMARNHLRAVSLGTGRYVTILQDDDLMLPGNLSRKLEILESRPDVAMVHSAFRLETLDGEIVDARANWDLSPVDVIRSGEEFLWRTLALGRRTHLSASVYRRAALDAETLTPLDGESIELALSLRAAYHGAVGFVAAPLCVVRLHPRQNSFASGVSDMVDGRMVRTFEQVALYHQITSRFLAHYPVSRREELAVRSRRWVGHELRRQIVEQLPPRPAPLVAVRRLREAQRVEAATIRTPKVAWVGVNALLGRRGRERLRRLKKSFERRVSGTERTSS